MIQIIPQTWQERYEMYMKCSKEDLASMLAERDKYTYPEGCKECIKEYKSTSSSCCYYEN